ncbi:MAG: hypothetical protein Q7T21_07175 [Gallionella sp.]|nr:hypothetical protein [Gallionella sp.]
MPNFTDLTGLASVASALAASLLLLPWTKRLANRHRAWATAAVFVIALIPFNGLPLAANVRGATGDLSITTLALLWCALLRPWSGCGELDSRHRLALLALIALAAVALYPMALGFGAFDPYRLGYGNWLFVAMLMLAALAAWFWKYYLIALCIALAALAWAAGWYESVNLWDYLLDPFVAIYALSVLMIHAVKTLVKPQRDRPAP